MPDADNPELGKPDMPFVDDLDIAVDALRSVGLRGGFLAGKTRLSALLGEISSVGFSYVFGLGGQGCRIAFREPRIRPLSSRQAHSSCRIPT
jgi:hypothetical protein